MECIFITERHRVTLGVNSKLNSARTASFLEASVVRHQSRQVTALPESDVLLCIKLSW